MPESLSWVPDACALPLTALPSRLAEFDELIAAAVQPAQRSAATRLRLVLPGAWAAGARDLAARESECCSFFTFTLTPAGDELLLDIAVPPAHTAVLDALAARAAQPHLEDYKS